MKKTTMFSLFALMLIGLITITGFVSAYRGDYSVKSPYYNEERHDLIEDTFDALDYDAWYDLMTENERHPRIVDVVTEDNFETFVNAHNAAENGDYEKAAQLRAEFGLNDGNGPKDGTGFGKRLNQGRNQKMYQNNIMDTNNNGR